MQTTIETDEKQARAEARKQLREEAKRQKKIEEIKNQPKLESLTITIEPPSIGKLLRFLCWQLIPTCHRLLSICFDNNSLRSRPRNKVTICRPSSEVRCRMELLSPRVLDSF